MIDRNYVGRRRPAPDHGGILETEHDMFDLICPATFAAFFLVAAAFIRGCERLEDQED